MIFLNIRLMSVIKFVLSFQKYLKNFLSDFYDFAIFCSQNETFNSLKSFT